MSQDVGKDNPSQRIMEELTGAPMGTKFPERKTAKQINDEKGVLQRIQEELSGKPIGTDFTKTKP